MEHELINRIDGVQIYFGNRNADYYTQPHHFHNWYEIFLITNGECEFFIYDKIYIASKGHTILLKPGVFHYYTSKKGCEYIVIEISAGYISSFFTVEASDTVLRCFETDSVVLDDSEILECMRYASIAGREKTESNADRFLAIGNLLNFLCKKSGASEFKKDDTRRTSADKLNYITDYISTHYNEIHAAEDIMKACYISKSHLFRLFKNELGQSVSDYVNNIKIHAASEMLLSENMPVLDIAFECGFNSPQHFYKIFKGRIGCSPREFVNRHKV